MAEELIIKCCAPTLAGLKLGSIFCLGNYCKDMGRELKRCVDILKSKGLEVKGTKGCKGQRLIYVYRPEELKSMVSEKCNACLLNSFGYNTNDTNETVKYLLDKIRYQEEFPHEIGLFLGYPPEDVIGYIENNGKNFLISGMWKVYNNEDRAKKCFNSYKKCTQVYMKCYKNGTSLDRLTVKERIK